MKKLMAVLLTLVMTFGLTAVTFASPPNEVPGQGFGPVLTTECGIHVAIVAGTTGSGMLFNLEIYRLNPNSWALLIYDVNSANFLRVVIQGNALTGVYSFVPRNLNQPEPVYVFQGFEFAPATGQLYRHHQHSAYGRQRSSLFGSVEVTARYVCAVSSNVKTLPAGSVGFDRIFGNGAFRALGQVFYLPVTYTDINGIEQFFMHTIILDVIVYNQGGRSMAGSDRCRRFETIPNSSVTPR